MALVGSKLEQRRGLLGIFGHAVSVDVQESEGILRGGIALLSGSLERLHESARARALSGYPDTGI